MGQTLTPVVCKVRFNITALTAQTVQNRFPNTGEHIRTI